MSNPTVKELVNKCLEVDLLQYVQTVGYRIVKGKESNTFVSLKNDTTGDGIRIKVKVFPMVYNNNDANLENYERGNIINFVINRQSGAILPNPKPTGTQFRDAFNTLLNVTLDPNFKNDYQNEYKKRNPQTEEEEIKYKIKDLKNVEYSAIKYLNRRSINPNILNTPLFSGTIKESPVRLANGTVISNIAFIKKDIDNQTVGFQVQYPTICKTKNIPINQKMVYQIKDSVWKSNFFDTTTKLFFGEASIDCLSHYEMNQAPNVGYVSYDGQMSSDKADILFKLFQSIQNNSDTPKLISITDNDYNGYGYDLNTALHFHNKLQPESPIEKSFDKNVMKLIYHQNLKDGHALELKNKMHDILRIEEPKYYNLLKTYLNVIELKGKTIIEIPHKFNYQDVTIKPFLFTEPLIKTIFEYNSINFCLKKSKSIDWNEDLKIQKEKIQNNQKNISNNISL